MGIEAVLETDFHGNDVLAGAFIVACAAVGFAWGFARALRRDYVNRKAAERDAR